MANQECEIEGCKAHLPVQLVRLTTNPPDGLRLDWQPSDLKKNLSDEGRVSNVTVPMEHIDAQIGAGSHVLFHVGDGMRVLFVSRN